VRKDTVGKELFKEVLPCGATLGIIAGAHMITVGVTVDGTKQGLGISVSKDGLHASLAINLSSLPQIRKALDAVYPPLTWQEKLSNFVFGE
jgi:hypothetical protein